MARAAAEVAALLRAGAGPAAAWSPQRCPSHADPSDAGAAAVPSPVDLALDGAARAAAEGGDPAAALLAAAVPGPARAAVEAMALAWRTSEVTGAPAATVLDRLAAGLADDAAAQDARDAALAGPRATARLLLALPVAGLLLGGLVGADPVGVLVGTSAGRVCAAAGTAFALAGWAWSSMVVRSAERAG